MLRVDERGQATLALRFGDHLQRQGRFARRFRAEDFDDAAARESADAQGEVDADGAGRDRFGRGDGVALAKAHDGALAELLLDLYDGKVERLDPFLSFVHWHVLVLSRAKWPPPLTAARAEPNAPTEVHTRNGPGESQGQIPADSIQSGQCFQ